MKLNKILSGGAIFTALLMMVPSCDEFGIVTTTPGGDDVIGGGLIPDSGKPSEELDSAEQKEKLEQVGLKLMKKCPSDDVKNFLDVYDAFSNAYLETEDYSFEALEDFAQDVVNSSYTEEEERDYDALKKEFIANSVYNLTIALANHKGEFTFGDDAVVCTDSVNVDGVRVKFTLAGKNYVAEIRQSGKITKALYDYRDYYESNAGSGYYDENDNWIQVEGGLIRKSQDLLKVSVDVPEKIEISLTEDGASMASITLGFKQSFTAAGLNPAVDNFNVDVNVVLNNGYEISAAKVSFDGAGNTAGGAVVFKKDGEALVSAASSAKVSLENTVEKWEDTWGTNDKYYDKSEYTSVKLNKAKDVAVSVDILGEVQLAGVCSDAKELSELTEDYWDALNDYDYETDSYKIPDEAAALRHLNNINAKLNLKVYYDRGSNAQAKVEFEMGKEFLDWDQNYDGFVDTKDVDYYLVPVIVFNDNSRYAFENYFTEAAFKALIDESESFADDYSDLFGIYFEAEEDLEMGGQPSEDFTR